MLWNKQALKKWILWSNPKDSPEKIAFKRALQVHLVFVLLLCFGSFSIPSNHVKQRMRIHSTHLETKKVLDSKQKTVLDKPSQTTQKAVLDRKKKETKLNKESTLTIKSTPEKAKPLKPPASQRLKELDSKLEKIEKSFQAPPKEIFVAAESTKETFLMVQYETQVIHVLQLALKLIDKEPVDVTITVQPNGIIDTIHHIHSLSSLNAKIVETTLNKMVFPAFEGAEPIELTLHLCTDPS